MKKAVVESASPPSAVADNAPYDAVLLTACDAVQEALETAGALMRDGLALAARDGLRAARVQLGDAVPLLVAQSGAALAAGDAAEAREMADRAVVADPLSAAARFAAAEAVRASGRDEEAWAGLRLAHACLRVADLGGQAGAEAEASMAACHAEDIAELAENLMAADRDEEARSAIDAVLAGRPACTPARIANARHLWRAGNAEAALAELDDVPAWPSVPHQAALLRATIVDAQGDPAGALPWADIAAAGGAGVAAHCQRGQILRRLKRADDAVHAFRRAFEVDPDHTDALAGMVSALRDGGRAAEALAYARRAVALAPDDPWRHVALGNVLARMDDADGAVEAYARADGLRTGLAGVAGAYGRQLRVGGHAREAADMLARAAAERPKDHRLMEEIAAIYSEAGAHGDARVWYRRRLEVGDCPATRDSLQRLQAAGPRLKLSGDMADDVRVHDAFVRVPVLARAARKRLRLSLLDGGVHNTLVRIRGTGVDLVLRFGVFPPKNWRLADEEARNTATAHAAGLGPKVHFVDRADGTMVMDFLEGRTMKRKDIRTPERLAEVARLYRSLHEGPAFFGRYSIFGLMDSLRRRVVAAEDPVISETTLRRYASISAAVGRVLRQTSPPPVPCHNDPAPQNLIATADGVRLIDWQCAGMSDPHWELGALIADEGLGADLRNGFLDSYFQGGDRFGRARVVLFSFVSLHFWLLQYLDWVAQGKEADYWRKAAHRKAAWLDVTVNSDTFAAALDLVSRGVEGARLDTAAVLAGNDGQ